MCTFMCIAYEKSIKQNLCTNNNFLTGIFVISTPDLFKNSLFHTHYDGNIHLLCCIINVNYRHVILVYVDID
jgi:hypothetical protein